MSAVIPRDWRFLRAFLKALGTVVLVVATVALTEPPWPLVGPRAVRLATYIGAPLAVAAVAAVVSRRQSDRVRWPARAVAVTGALVVVANVAYAVQAEYLVDDLEEMLAPPCAQLAECRDMALSEFAGEPQPRLPTVQRVDGYRFDHGTDMGPVGFWYGADGAGVPTLAYLVGKRHAGGYEPPADAAVFLRTPGGTDYVEGRRDEGVHRLDFWDDTYHYAVSLQGAYDPGSVEYARAVALIDSAR